MMKTLPSLYHFSDTLCIINYIYFPLHRTKIRVSTDLGAHTISPHPLQRPFHYFLSALKKADFYSRQGTYFFFFLAYNCLLCFLNESLNFCSVAYNFIYDFIYLGSLLSDEFS